LGNSGSGRTRKSYWSALRNIEENVNSLDADTRLRYRSQIYLATGRRRFSNLKGDIPLKQVRRAYRTYRAKRERIARKMQREATRKKFPVQTVDFYENQVETAYEAAGEEFPPGDSP